MDLTIAKETIERRSDAGTSVDPLRGGASSPCMDAPAVDLSTQVVEDAWLLKSKMRWVRNDRGPLNALRWFVKDSLDIGDPPSKVEFKSH